ncbi:MAG TPA: vWA domain-containing protein, partial [Chloroflexia bacterium]|nr:vWA domain-containing protein [Chloroflexia bacterium]
MIGELGLSFSRPVALLLLLLLVPLTVYLSRTSLAFLRRGARRWSLGLRLAIVVLLVLSLAGAGIVRADQRLSVVYLLDRSDSVSAGAQAQQAEYVAQAIAELRDGDAAGVIVFGSDALVDRPVQPDKTPPDLASAPSTTYSNLADALRLGLAVAPGDTARRLVLLSDGRENLGSAEWAARLAGANGVAVDVVALPTASGHEVWVDSLRAPSPVRENERVSLQLGISSSVDTTATLLISMDGTPLSTQEVRLVRGANSYVQTLPPATRGFHTYS